MRLGYRRMLRNVGRIVVKPSAVVASLSWHPFSYAAFELMHGVRGFGVSPTLIIDVGANQGQFSRAAREVFGQSVRIVGFEPLKNEYNILCRNFEGDSNAIFRNCAIGATTSTGEINVNSYSQSSSMMSLGKHHISAFPSAQVIGKEEIDVVRLDDAMHGIEWTKNSLLKIDVQGYELKVLEGAPLVLSQVNFVLVEVGLVPLYDEEPEFNEINNFLERAGFEFAKPLAKLRDDCSGIEIQMDALYKRRP